MKLFISQSNYIPWRGFFHLLMSCDKYIVYDSMQFTKNDWRNRNLIRNNNSIRWLSIPCGKSISRKINEVFPSHENWYVQHADLIRMSYIKSPYWQEYGNDLINFILSLKGLSLSEVNVSLIQYAADLLDINCEIVVDTDLNLGFDWLTLERNQRLIYLCKQLNATTYLSAPAAKNYVDEELFISNKLILEYFKYPEYPLYHDYGRELSWIDSLMYNGSLLIDS